MKLNSAFFDITALNLQLLFGFVFSYDYLTRHVIVSKVWLFVFLVFLLSNAFSILFIRFKRLIALKNFLIISIGLWFLSYFFYLENWPKSTFDLVGLGMLYLYISSILYLHITTPIVFAFEYVFKKKELLDRKN